MTKRLWIGVSMVILVLVVAAFVVLRALGLRNVEVQAEPWTQPEAGFDYGPWDASLERWVRGTRVDYARVLEDEQALRRFAATLAVFGPETTPERFPTEQDRLAYYINAYNALTLLGVVDNWPIDSVQDVRGWLEPKPGFGFFYGLRFPLDGQRINLYDLENQVIRGFGDARIHAAINCASVSCPPLAPFAYTPGRLDRQLDEATRAFCAPPHVRIDEKAERIELSAIFDWYRVDFENDATPLGEEPTQLGFILACAEPETAETLRSAEAAGFEVSYQPYDWNLNRL